jgi:hypothetical protein
MNCGIYDGHLFLQRKVQEYKLVPQQGDHSIGKNMRNLKLIFRHFCSILGSIMSIPAIGLNDASTVIATLA